jgi:WD40 repeat protein
MSFSPDGKTVLTSSLDPGKDIDKLAFQKWNVKDGKRVKNAPNFEAITAPIDFVWSHAADRMAGTSKSIGLILEGELFVFRADDGALVRKRKHPNYLAKLAFSPDGWRLAVSSFRNDQETGAMFTILDWDLKNDTATVVTSGRGNEQPIAYSPDGKRFYFGDGEQKKLWAWDVEKQATVELVSQFPIRGESIAVSPGGRMIVIGDQLIDVSFPSAKKK